MGSVRAIELVDPDVTVQLRSRRWLLSACAHRHRLAQVVPARYHWVPGSSIERGHAQLNTNIS